MDQASQEIVLVNVSVTPLIRPLSFSDENEAQAACT
jgi:hypothetical protein